MNISTYQQYLIFKDCDLCTNEKRKEISNKLTETHTKEADKATEKWAKEETDIVVEIKNAHHYHKEESENKFYE